MVGAWGDDDRVRPPRRHRYQRCPAWHARYAPSGSRTDALVVQDLEQAAARRVVAYTPDHDHVGPLAGRGHGLVEAFAPGDGHVPAAADGLPRARQPIDRYDVVDVQAADDDHLSTAALALDGLALDGLALDGLALDGRHPARSTMKRWT